MSWGDYQDRDVVNRRAGGRRRINAERKAKAWERRNKIKELIGGYFLLLGSGYAWGLETTIAEYFGVHRSTISRDKEALLAEWRKDRSEKIWKAERKFLGIKIRQALKRKQTDGNVT